MKERHKDDIRNKKMLCGGPALCQTQLRSIFNREKEIPVWAKEIHRNCKKNAAAREIPFSLSEMDVVEMALKSKGFCAVTKVQLRIGYSARKGQRRPWHPSIDRIDSRDGYTRSNCRIVCVAANLAMSTWGDWVLLEMLSSMRAKRSCVDDDSGDEMEK